MTSITPAEDAAGFQPLELKDLGRLRERLRPFPPQVSEQTFTNLYVWRYRRPVRWAQVDGALLFLELYYGERRVLGPPCGELETARLLQAAQAAGAKSFERLTASTADELGEAGLRVEADRDNADYVYLREDLALLEGRRYHTQKNLVNRCLRAYRCEYCELDKSVLDEAANMVERWFEEREGGLSPGLAEEYWALRETLDHFSDFGLLGGAVRIKGRMEALAVCEAQNENTAVVHFEKAASGYKGLYQVINNWVCLHALSRFDFVNREQDLGIPGLRRAKESYNPHHLVEKYTARWGAGTGVR